MALQIAGNDARLLRRRSAAIRFSLWIGPARSWPLRLHPGQGLKSFGTVVKSEQLNAARSGERKRTRYTNNSLVNMKTGKHRYCNWNCSNYLIGCLNQNPIMHKLLTELAPV
jgi:hypothetical protein